TADDLTAVYTFNDVDGDLESGTLIQWFKNGLLVPALNGLLTVPAASTDIGQQWRFEMTPADGIDFGATVSSPSVTVAGSPNTAPTLNPIGARTVDEGATFVINISATDPDPGHTAALNFTYTGSLSWISINNSSGQANLVPGYTVGGQTYSATFRVTDPLGAFDEEIISITVNNVNDPPVANASLSATSVQEFASGQLDGTASGDPDGDAIVAYTWAQTGGTPVTLLPSHTVAKPSFGAPGVGSGGATATFALTVRDSFGLDSNAVTVNMTITNVNQNPAAVDDTVTVSQNTKDNILDLLDNDTDDDGDLLKITAVSDPPKGTAAVSADGLDVLYTPDNGFSGSDSFTYTISDGFGGTDSGLVTITVSSNGSTGTGGGNSASSTSSTSTETTNTTGNTSAPFGGIGSAGIAIVGSVEPEEASVPAGRFADSGSEPALAANSIPPQIIVFGPTARPAALSTGEFVEAGSPLTMEDLSFYAGGNGEEEKHKDHPQPIFGRTSRPERPTVNALSAGQMEGRFGLNHPASQQSVTDSSDAADISNKKTSISNKQSGSINTYAFKIWNLFTKLPFGGAFGLGFGAAEEAAARKAYES
ncbi:MAG: cadherin-like domain-containing protein, partial [Candidatus Omnitrophica bacterium]|nr:cadherin-like domain-containing protein [Candidatus Omnitrophota bacterium]